MHKNRPSHSANNGSILQQDRHVAKKPDQRPAERRENKIVKDCVNSNESYLGQQFIEARTTDEVPRIPFFRKP